MNTAQSDSQQPEGLPSPPLGTMISRCLRLRCVLCGSSKLFTHWFRMHDVCPDCGYRFEREGGYFLGSIYFNYGGAAVLTVAGYFVLDFGFDATLLQQLLILLLVAAVFPLWFFRYSRALWMAMDLSMDPPTAKDYPGRSDTGPPGIPGK